MFLFFLAGLEIAFDAEDDRHLGTVGAAFALSLGLALMVALGFDGDGARRYSAARGDRPGRHLVRDRRGGAQGRRPDHHALRPARDRRRLARRLRDGDPAVAVLLLLGRRASRPRWCCCSCSSGWSRRSGWSWPGARASGRAARGDRAACTARARRSACGSRSCCSAALVYMSEEFGLEVVLGAFLAGAMVSLLDREQRGARSRAAGQARGHRLRRLHPDVLRGQRREARPRRAVLVRSARSCSCRSR